VTQRDSAFLQNAARYRFVYLDLQDARCHTLQGLLGQITTELGIRGKIGQLSLVTFQDAIIALKQQGILPVICLDEFEELVERQTAFPGDVYDSWRSLMNQHALAFITASKTPLPALAQAAIQSSSTMHSSLGCIARKWASVRQMSGRLRAQSRHTVNSTAAIPAHLSTHEA